MDNAKPNYSGLYYGTSLVLPNFLEAINTYLSAKSSDVKLC